MAEMVFMNWDIINVQFYIKNYLDDNIKVKIINCKQNRNFLDVYRFSSYHDP